MKRSVDVTVTFPILVYFDQAERVWVAQSLMTCTTAVNADDKVALDELYRLLDAELDAALEASGAEIEPALQMIYCPAPQELWRLYFFNAVAVPTASSKGSPTKTGKSVTLTRVAAATA